MNDRAMTPSFQRAAAVAGALICLVIIFAMFLEPAPKGGPPGEQARAAMRVRNFRFTAENILGLFVVGLVASTFGGMLGMGGGVLKMSSLLLFFGFHPGISRFAALLSYFVVTVGASYRYLKLRFVTMDVVKILVPSSVVGIIFGAIVGHHLPRDAMTILLGMFLLFISMVMLRRIVARYRDVSSDPGASRPQDLEVRGKLPPASSGPALGRLGQLSRRAEPVEDSRAATGGPARERGHAIEPPRGRPAPAAAGWVIAVCGFPGGFLSAMLGISGGIVTNPLQQVLARIPIKGAIANTLAKASVTVPIACLMIMAMGIRGGDFDFWTPVLVALCLIPGSVIGSQLGPSLTTRMSFVAIHVLFCAVALFMAINMLFFSG